MGTKMGKQVMVEGLLCVFSSIFKIVFCFFVMLNFLLCLFLTFSFVFT